MRTIEAAQHRSYELFAECWIVLDKAAEVASAVGDHHHLVNCLGGEPMSLAAFKAEDILREVEGVDLPAPVGEQLAGADRAGDDLVEDAAGLALGEDLLAAVEGAANAGSCGLRALGQIDGAAQGDGGGKAGIVGGGEGLHRSLLRGRVQTLGPIMGARNSGLPLRDPT